jgi:uncharacterized protein
MMAVFKVSCKKGLQYKNFYFNNINNTLSDIYQKEVKLGIADLSSPKIYYDNINTVKLSLGNSCNLNCAYCFQDCLGDRKGADDIISASSLSKMVSKLNLSKIPLIEFWGGEPLLYWDYIVDFVAAIKEYIPSSKFSLVTNGSLLDFSKNEWLARNGFSVVVSHDGPGHYLRGKNILEDIEQQGVIQNLFNLLFEEGRFSFGPTLTRYNCDRQQIIKWFEREVGHKFFILAGGMFFHPSDSKHLELCFKSEEEHVAYRKLFMEDLRNNIIYNFVYIRHKVDLFNKFITQNIHCNNVEEICGLDKVDVIGIDRSGNILTCHAIPANAGVNNGFTTTIGNIKSMELIDRVNCMPLRGWHKNEKCKTCCVLSLCGGGCSATPISLNDISCAHYFSDYISIFGYVVEELTGFFPVSMCDIDTPLEITNIL